MIKYLPCAEFTKTLRESLERTDATVEIFKDIVGNVGFNVTEKDVVHTYYSPDKTDVQPDIYIEFADELNRIIRSETEKKVLGDLT